jgi:hypothetical protein
VVKEHGTAPNWQQYPTTPAVWRRLSTTGLVGQFSGNSPGWPEPIPHRFGALGGSLLPSNGAFWDTIMCLAEILELAPLDDIFLQGIDYLIATFRFISVLCQFRVHFSLSISKVLFHPIAIFEHVRVSMLGYGFLQELDVYPKQTLCLIVSFLNDPARSFSPTFSQAQVGFVSLITLAVSNASNHLLTS